MLKHALDYCHRGWSVIPIQWYGERKAPLVPWAQYQEYAADEDQIREWWTKWPEAGIGIVTGSVSRLVVVDMDGPEAAGILEQEGIRLPQTASVQTGGGYHAYFVHPGGTVKTCARLFSAPAGGGVDVRGDGGYVVAPPSVHRSGRVYQWTVEPDYLAPYPQSLVEVGGEDSYPLADWIEEAISGVEEGKRNDAAAKVAGYWLKVTSNNKDAALNALKLWNTQNRPPLPDSELETVVQSISKRESKSGTSRDHRVYDGSAMAELLANTEPRAGIKLDLPGIDLIGGLVPGDLIILAGRPGEGKSTLACQLCAIAALSKKIPTLVISSEMTAVQWGTWMSVSHTGDPDEKEAVRKTIALYKKSPIRICDTGSITANDVRIITEGSLGVKLVIVDHIQRLRYGSSESRTRDIGDAAKMFKSLAKDCGCTFLVLSQLSRDVARQQEAPDLHHLRESGDIEQEADAVMFIATMKMQKSAMASISPKSETDRTIFLKKNRFGPLTKEDVVLLPNVHRFERRF